MDALASAESHIALVCPLDWTLRMKVALDVTSALAHMHSLTPPIVHRDLKTPNILLASPLHSFRGAVDTQWHSDSDLTNALAQPLAKIADFGLSKHLFSDAIPSLPDTPPAPGGSTSSPSSSVGQGMVNITWSAPEVIRSQVATPAADVYSLGLILWELAARCNPFEKELQERRVPNDPAVANAFLAKYVCGGGRPLLDPAWPSPYTSLIQRCWDPRMDARPTATEVLACLYNMCEDLAPSLSRLVLSRLDESTTNSGSEQNKGLGPRLSMRGHSTLARLHRMRNPFSSAKSTTVSESHYKVLQTVSMAQMWAVSTAVMPEVKLERRLQSELEERAGEMIRSANCSEAVGEESVLHRLPLEMAQAQLARVGVSVQCASCRGSARQMRLLNECKQCSRLLCHSCFWKGQPACYTCLEIKRTRASLNNRSTSVRVQCMCFAVDYKELWAGLKSGRVISFACRRLYELDVDGAAWSAIGDSHTLPVNAVVAATLGGKEMIFTGSEDGLMKGMCTRMVNLLIF